MIFYLWKIIRQSFHQNRADTATQSTATGGEAPLAGAGGMRKALIGPFACSAEVVD